MWVLLALALGLLGLGQALGTMLEERRNVPPAEEASEVRLMTGTVVRSEVPVYLPDSRDWVLQRDNCRVSPGQSLYCLGREQRQTDAVEEASPVALRQRIHETVARINEGQSTPEELRNLMTGREETVSYEVTDRVEAAVGGWFVARADGLEEVLTPDWQGQLLPSAEKDPLLVGRIITSETWYFRVMGSYGFAPGEEVKVLLLSGAFREALLQVEDAGAGWVLFSCEEGVEYVAGLRQLWVKILPE